MNLENNILDIIEKLKNGNKAIENRFLDVKGEWYSKMKKNSRWQDEFAKDICGIANNIEAKKGYLIFGIMEERSPYLNNISISEDNATLHDIIRSQIKPIPAVEFSTLNIHGYDLFVVSIQGSLEDLPYFALRKKNDNYHIFIRRGSRTDYCRKEDLTRLLKSKREKEIDIRIEAEALGALKKLEYQSRRNLDTNDLDSFLDKVSEYGEEYGERVAIRVLLILINISSRLRLGGLNDIAMRLSSIALNTLDFVNYKNKRIKGLSSDQILLLERIIDLGHNLGYDGARRLQSEQVINAGLDLLWGVLRFAHLNNYSNIKEKANNAFNVIIDWSNRMELSDTAIWTKYRREDALALSEENSPEFPRDISEKFLRL